MDVATKSQTVGSAAIELASRGDQNQSVIETQKAMQKGYVDELIKAATSGKAQYPDEKRLYVCVQTRRERLLDNVIRNQFYVRRTRPIPQYDLALYYYDCQDEKLTFVWCIPDKETVDRFCGGWVLDDGKKVWLPGDRPALGEEQLASFCRNFRAGTLV